MRPVIPSRLLCLPQRSYGSAFAVYKKAGCDLRDLRGDGDRDNPRVDVVPMRTHIRPEPAYLSKTYLIIAIHDEFVVHIALAQGLKRSPTACAADRQCRKILGLIRVCLF